MRTFALLAAIAAALFAAACDPPDHIEIKPKEPVLRHRGETLQLEGDVYDHGGQIIAKAFPTWSSRDPFIATVDQHGKVAGLASGQTEIIAHYGGLTARVPLEVNLVELLKVDQDHYVLDLKSGNPVTPRFTTLGLANRPLGGRPVMMHSEDEQVVRVDPMGEIIPVGKGKTIVQATCDEKEIDLHVTVK